MIVTTQEEIQAFRALRNTNSIRSKVANGCEICTTNRFCEILSVNPGLLRQNHDWGGRTADSAVRLLGYSTTRKQTDMSRAPGEDGCSFYP